MELSREQVNYLELDDVLKMVHMSKSTLYAKMREGEFPLARRTGGKCVVWVESEIREWMATRPTYKPKVQVVRLSRLEAARNDSRRLVAAGV